MSDMLDELCHVLQVSVKKHGDKPLTTLHLLNIIKMVARRQEELAQREERLSARVAETDHLWR